ncbi:MAG: hypothetical protein IT174_10800 [Acidobacteria bacterium]|nr:hypothetical protein [Acidobacteriota bacterium]
MRIDTSRSWISKTLESSYNTPEATGSNYSEIPTQEPYFVLPKLEKTSDADRVGQDAPTHLCNTYWSHGEIGLRDDAETDVPARLFRRALGGSVTDTVVSAGAVWDHTFAILPRAASDFLPSFSVATLLGSASFLLAGCMIDRFKVSQKNSERVQHETDILSGGKFTNPHGLTSLPSLVDTACMDGFRTNIQYTDSDGSTTVNLTTAGKVIEWMVEHKNNIRRNKRRTGDPIQTVSSSAGAYVRSMPRGKYETSVQMVIDFVDLTEWTKSVQNAVFTNMKITVVGPIITGIYRHEFEIIIPKFGFDSPDTSDDEGDAATPINIIPFKDPTSGGTITGRIRNAQGTLV